MVAKHKSTSGIRLSVAIAVALVAVICAALPLRVAHAQSGAVGLVTRVTGVVEVRTGNDAWRPLRLMQRLNAGDVIRCGTNGAVSIVHFKRADRFEVRAGTTATLAADGVQGGQRTNGLHGSAIQVAKAMGGTRDLIAFSGRPAPQGYQRLAPNFPGWMNEGDRHFDWSSVVPAGANAASYCFTLTDSRDNIVWAVRTTETNAEYPANLPYLALRQPYIWHVTPFGKSGKPLLDARWGVVTFLGKPDADALTTQAQELDEQAKADAADTTPLILLAELYRSYGVLARTLEVLDKPALVDSPDVKREQGEVYRALGPYALRLTGVPPQ